MLFTGIDLVEIRKVEHAVRNPRFCRRILGPDEYDQLQKRGFPIQSVAASFCAKEAFAKALGTGVRGFSLNEVELLREENGRPVLSFRGRAEAMVRERSLSFSVSVTHTGRYAAAVVVGEGASE